MKYFDIISPDGFSISRDEYWRSPKEAVSALMEWRKGYKRQGYYSSVKFGRIHYDDIPDFCTLVEVDV